MLTALCLLDYPSPVSDRGGAGWARNRWTGGSGEIIASRQMDFTRRRKVNKTIQLASGPSLLPILTRLSETARYQTVPFILSLVARFVAAVSILSVVSTKPAGHNWIDFHLISWKLPSIYCVTVLSTFDMCE